MLDSHQQFIFDISALVAVFIFGMTVAVFMYLTDRRKK